MTALDAQLSALRRRRTAPSLMSRLRRLPFLDRRAIRDPDERDIFWTRVRERLAQSDAASLRRYWPRGSDEPPRPTTLSIG